ncbi:MAG: DUF72 domain-containing protein [Gemmatimonadetes bacterium]|nr:MAG: DUF72 domain-containing protein [Gemmatimonadota bacterium]PYO79756.1 MAG: DUF72 domain-containing protein [Gemmatimonadota bacterium]
MKILAGTSGYAFKEWKGNFYPQDLKDDGMLGFYASKFPTVEINNTFYRLPRENVLRDWAAQVPETFTFALKASQRITHYARLKEESASLVDFLLKNTATLGDRLGPILFQLPPNMKKDVNRFRGFLGLLPFDRRYAFEFRHDSWFDDEVYSALRERDIAMCIAEQDDFTCPVICTSTWGYLRLHKLDYNAGELVDWAKRVVGQQWNEAYVFFKHDETEHGGSGPPAVETFVGACG